MNKKNDEPVIKVTDEMVKNAAEAYAVSNGMNPNNWQHYQKHIRAALEAALS